MKKIIALLAVLATLVSLSACKLSREKTPEQIAAEQSKAIAQSQKAEKDFQEGMDKTVDKLGKTEKGKRLVIGVSGSVDEEYDVYEFDKKQVLKNRYRYVFCSTPENYEQRLEIGDRTRSEIVDRDKKARLVVYKVDFTEDPELTFDYLYEMYSSDYVAENGGFIVE